ncbi:MAG: prephenate dehydratase [Firmicutes bacterium]|nr:prephenate dehydratase [Bacillota bacterium]MBQ9605089.1 prephenate dehydratase [Bacillota bacterium]
MKAGYLGPLGTFSHQAALEVFDENEIRPYDTIYQALMAVGSGELEYAAVPIENSTEGTVNATVDALIFDLDLYIQKLIVLPIRQNLMIKKDTDIKNIKTVYSHPHALAQCRHYLYENFETVPQIAAQSTAAAAKMVSESDEPIAAVAPEVAAKVYGLELAAKGIQDSKINYTEFVVVGKKPTTELVADKNYKTTICFSTVHEPGSLYKLLDILSIWDVNMSRIVSRPMRNHPREYVFYIDLEKEDNAKDLQDALTMLKRKTSFFKILGSYPVIDKR